MVLPASHKVSRVSWYSGVHSKDLLFRLQDYYLLRWDFPDLFDYNDLFIMNVSATPKRNLLGLGSSPFARRYWGNRIFFLFLRVLRCFSSPGCLHTTYVFSSGYLGINPGGFPHSEIFGSKLACSSPKLIAAYHVLHRLLVPRHPPYALNNLTS